MKNLISFLGVILLMMGTIQVSAQSELTESESTVIYSDDDKQIIQTEKVKKCAKSDKICDSSCKNKKTGTCCKGEKKTCSKSNGEAQASMMEAFSNEEKKEKTSCSSKEKTSCSSKEKSTCSKTKSKCSKENEESACCSKK